MKYKGPSHLPYNATLLLHVDFLSTIEPRLLESMNSAYMWQARVTVVRSETCIDISSQWVFCFYNLLS